MVLLSPEEEIELLEAIGAADHGETISVEQLFSRLDGAREPVQDQKIY